MSNHKNNPLISVVIATKNEESNIRPLLESIQNQTYKNIEIIIVDHEQTHDKTKDIAHEFTQNVYTYGLERSIQRNYGIDKSRGVYVLLLDADMVVTSKVIESCLELLQNNPSATGVIIKEISVGEGFWAECKKLEKELIAGVDWIEAARFYPLTILKQLGGYDISLISGEDWDLSQRAKDLGLILRTDEPIYHKDIEASFIKNIKKKFFYGKHIAKYTSKSQNTGSSKKQMSIVDRYKVYLRDPRITFKKPIYGLGMLFIKTSEFGAIALGMVYSKMARGK